MDLLLRVLARLLPPLVRSRYLEEWRSDLAGAGDLGLRRSGVVLGAAMLLVRIDRDRPEISGEPRGTLPRRLARRGASLWAAAFVIAIGVFLTGGGIVPEAGSAPPAAIAAIEVAARLTVLLALAAGLAGAMLILLAVLVARTPLSRLSLLALVVGPGLLAASAVGIGSAVVPLAGLAISCAGLTGGIVVLAGTSGLELDDRTASREQRVPVTVAGSLLLAAVIVLGTVDLLVWNPLAKVPGLDLATIYALMAERDGFSLGNHVMWVAIWAGFWSALGIVVAVGAVVGRRSSLTPRRLAVLLLGLVGAAVFFHFFAGFYSGMSIADSFATGGGPGSLVGAALPHIGQLALAGSAVALGWAPRTVRHPTPADALSSERPA